jgi:hypothetical protein
MAVYCVLRASPPAGLNASASPNQTNLPPIEPWSLERVSENACWVEASSIGSANAA